MPLRLTVAVPTFQRNDELTALLPLLAEQLGGLRDGGVEAELLVIDNDPGRGAEPVARSVAARYVGESTPGVVAVRNRALDETAGQDLLVFLDDDQRPGPGWLAALVGHWRQAAGGRPGAVAGPVRSVLPAGTDPWIRDGGFFDRAYRARLRTGDVIGEVATTNLLLDLHQVRDLGVRFDPGLGLSGGEDSLFTRSLTGGGARITWCVEAAVTEPVPAGRLTRRWVCHRALSSGNTTARITLMLNPARRRPALRIRLGARGLARIGGGVAGWLAGAVQRSPGRQGRSARTLYRGLGLLAGAADLSYLEYSRSGVRLRRMPVTSVSRQASRQVSRQVSR